MNSHLDTAKMLALLEDLRTVVSDIAAREDELNKDFRKKTYSERRDFEEAVQELEAELSGEITKADSAYRVEEARIEEAHEKRVAAIARAHKTCKHENERREKHHQKQLLNDLVGVERDYAADLAAAAKTLEDFRARLTESRAMSCSRRWLNPAR